jgi:hypothetical protein
MEGIEACNAAVPNTRAAVASGRRSHREIGVGAAWPLSSRGRYGMRDGNASHLSNTLRSLRPRREREKEASQAVRARRADASVERERLWPSPADTGGALCQPGCCLAGAHDKFWPCEAAKKEAPLCNGAFKGSRNQTVATGSEETKVRDGGHGPQTFSAFCWRSWRR